jgi:hydrogenase maturation protein HypF
MSVVPITRLERLHILLEGAVQGLGFRPTVYRIASSLRVAGWVRNTGAGLEIEVEGVPEQLDVFLRRLEAERPAAALITNKDVNCCAPKSSVGFEILGSENGDPAGMQFAAMLPDLATCPQCTAEIQDPANRRFGYPFTNCTLCGPRFSIVLDIPYDRTNTAMREFLMCAGCRREYDSHQDRRFHAQPNACTDCGPRLWTWPHDADSADPFVQAARALADGRIVAVKGIGGFHLMVDARNAAAVQCLRQRKHRDEKPFAMLMPSIESVHRYCDVSATEAELLLSSAGPIVLLKAGNGYDLAPDIAQTSPCVGVMLPSSPIHHLLMAQFPFPIVATSGNREGEPIAIDNEEATARLGEIADLFLLHNRTIVRACDDSVARILNGVQILRRARGYAPLPVLLPEALRPVLAVGGHLKNTVAISLGRQVFLSQHVGDLDSLESRETFERTIDDLCRLYRFEPEAIISDLHPDYASTQWAADRARFLGIPHVHVQHHHSHVAACAAENGLPMDFLGVAWDGAGLGIDGAIWGGEFFVASRSGFSRIAHLRHFHLPGGEAAMHDCSRSAAGILWEASGSGQDFDVEYAIAPAILGMLAGGMGGPTTSSIGRLFDAVAYLTGSARSNGFEGQAAMCLESAIGRMQSEQSYEITLREGIGDYASLITGVLMDQRRNISPALIALKFHNALANWILAVAVTANIHQVVLSGGVFQNAYLTARSLSLLEANGFKVYTHHQVPANDGGLALGQAVLGGSIQ